MSIVRRLHQLTDRCSLRMRLSLSAPRPGDAERRAMLDAIARGEGRRACGLLRAHILGAGRALVGFLRRGS